MTQQDLQLLADIYNGLLEVRVQGNDTFIMADCMRAFQKFIIDKGNEIKNKKEE
jgi:hypothetical protein